MFTITYALETGLCWLFFYVLYAIWLSKETFFRSNRIYLIGTLLLGLLIPAIDFIPAQQPEAIQEFSVYLNEVTILAHGNITTPDSSMDIGAALILIYKIGLAFFFLRFLIGIGGLFRLFIGSKIVRQENYVLIYTRREHTPFSFMHFIFVYQNMDFSEEEWEQVLLHEKTHIEGGHTLDVLLTEVLGILFWFNPLIYLYKNAIRNVHEYLADAAVIKTVPTVHYGRLLVAYALPGFRMANNFNHSQLKQRIIMMTKMQSPKQALAKYIFLLPVALLMLFVFSCQDDNNQAVEPETITQADRKESGKKLNEIADVMKRDDIKKELKAIEKEMIQENDPKRQAVLLQKKEAVINKELTPPNKINLQTPEEISKIDNVNAKPKDVGGRTNVYVMPEEMPRFPGCEHSGEIGEARKKCAEQKMLQHIYTNIVYPQEARDAGIEGMIVVSFIVEKDGSVNAPKILRSIGGGCDEEVLRLVNIMPSWIPGRHAGEAVATQFNLPVRFKLEGE